MKRKIRGVVVISLLIGLLLLHGVFASYDPPDGDWSTTTSSGETEEPSEDSDAGYTGWMSGGSGEDASDSLEDIYTEDAPGFSMYLGMRIYCHNPYLGSVGTNYFVVDTETTGYGHIFNGDFSNYPDPDTLLPFLPYDSWDSDVDIIYFVSNLGEYEWNSAISAVTSTLTLPTVSENLFENAKLHRFEGIPKEETDEWNEFGCIPWVGFLDVVDFTSDAPIAFNGKGEVVAGTAGQYPIYAYYYDEHGYNINWDKTQDDCTAINGAWNANADFSGYQCCGDDRMWIKNRAVNENQEFTLPHISNEEYNALGSTTSTTSYCLYGAGEDKQEQDVNINKEATSENYLCTDTGYSGYDLALDYDNGYETSEIVVKENPFFFQGTIGEDETDIGKWSDSSSLNPQFCYYEYNETTIGEEYYWIDINEAGDKPVDDEGEPITDFNNDHASTICESYLGGVWTGSHCCGNKYDYMGDYGDVEYYDESFSETVPIYYDEAQTQIYTQYACLQAAAYNDLETATYVTDDGTDDTDVELLNVDGTWYGCALDDVSEAGKDWYKVENGESTITLITDDTNIDGCTVMEDTYLCNYNYSDLDEDSIADNPRWEWYHLTNGDESDYVQDILGDTTSDDNIFAQSTPPWTLEEGLQTTACCANDRCWDGTACVDKYTDYVYDVDADAEENDPDDEHYICNNGDWGGAVETKYDWYYNTDAAAIDYCVNAYACVCSSNEEDETFCVEEGDYYEAGCTLTMDFFKNDHFCEAINPQDSDGDGTDDTADSSRWTSRTKFLAFQLMQIAEEQATDYTLFCDVYSNSLNNYVAVEAIAEDINSFCVLTQNDQVTLGVTFNSDDDEEPITVDADELLFEGSTAFVKQIVDNDNIDFSDCDDAISADQSGYRLGAYFSCDSSTTQGWYNSVMNGFIFSKDGLTTYGGTTLPYSDATIETYQTTLDTVKQTIVDYIDSTTITNPAGNELNDEETNYLSGFAFMQDYSKLYYSEESGTTTIGFEDIKYQEDYGNRYFLGVLYDGLTLDCDQVYAPYETTATIHCNSAMDSDTGIVLERSTSGSVYWNSLTAGIRIT